jgi:hypothetical protein
MRVGIVRVVGASLNVVPHVLGYPGDTVVPVVARSVFVVSSV